MCTLIYGRRGQEFRVSRDIRGGGHEWEPGPDNELVNGENDDVEVFNGKSYDVERTPRPSAA